jgi:hypothetical protein
MPRTDDTECGLLPTVRSTTNRTSRAALTAKQWSAPSLEQALELMTGALPREFESEDELSPVARRFYLLPTLTAKDAANAANCTASRRPGSKHHSGTTLVDWLRLNGLPDGRVAPEFAEWMMGYPEGWTALPPSDERSSRKSRPKS